MANLELNAAPRKTLGKKVQSLRRAGIVPVNVYGHEIDSVALQVEALALDKLLRRAGGTHLVSLLVESEPPRNVLVQEVQRRDGTGAPIHVSFYQVRMREKIKVEVPLHFIGESPAVKSKQADLMINIRSIEVECLPADIPSSINVDISHLAQVGDAIHISDLAVGEGITLLAEPGQMIVKIEPIKVVVEEVVKPVEAEVTEEAQPTEEQAKEEK